MSSSMPWGSRRLAASSAALVLAWLLARGVSAPLLEALAYLLPALALLGLLHARRYPGERALLAAMAAPRRRPGDRVSKLAGTRLPPRGRVPRGGRLIGCSLAVRPPPLAASPPL